MMQLKLSAFRAEVRDFLTQALKDYPPHLKAESWLGFDRDFSRKLGAQGYIGLTWPQAFGGHERSLRERHILQEELLAAGAPVAAHWVAERQSGPLIMRLGTDAQKAEILPKIIQGEITFCIGMSEPQAGSDLAAIRTRAERTAVGWQIEGRKLWTTHAAKADYMILLARTAPADPQKRHAGMSQFLVDMRTPGIEVRPIRDMSEAAHFNEVLFDKVALPPEALLGQEGQGWAQVMAELSFERSGPERFLSAMPVLEAFTQACDLQDPATRDWLGHAFAELVVLREMSRDIVDGATGSTDAAIVKDLGADFEQEIVSCVADLLGWDGTTEPEATDVFGMLPAANLSAPSFSLRGGTREILRGLIAKGTEI